MRKWVKRKSLDSVYEAEVVYDQLILILVISPSNKLSRVEIFVLLLKPFYYLTPRLFLLFRTDVPARPAHKLHQHSDNDKKENQVEKGKH